MKGQARKHFCFSEILFLLILGSVFIAVGLGVLIAVTVSVFRAGKVVVAALVPIFCFGLLPIAFGSIPLVLGIKRLRSFIGERKADRFGVESTARITDSKVVSHNGRLNRRFAFKLSYEWNGQQKSFVTDYLYDLNEFRYLQSLKRVKIKVVGKFVAISEPFPEDIYEINPRYEIETAFFKQSAVKKIFRIWGIVVRIAVLLLIGGAVLSAVLHRAIYLIVAAILFAAANVPLAVIGAVFLIKWMKQKRT